MLQTLVFCIPLAAGTSTAFYIVPPKASRLVSAKVANTGAIGATGSISLGKDGAAHTILSKTLNTVAAKTVTSLTDTASVTDDEKKQKFDADTPLVLTAISTNANQFTVTIEIDPFCAG